MTARTIPRKLGFRDILAMKARHQKFVMSTAFDFNMARILDEAGIDIIGTSASPMNLGGKQAPSPPG